MSWIRDMLLHNSYATLHTSPYPHLSHLAHITPLVKCNETCRWVVVVGGKVATNFSVSSRLGFKL